jgi:hypothetical protein
VRRAEHRAQRKEQRSLLRGHLHLRPAQRGGLHAQRAEDLRLARVLQEVRVEPRVHRDGGLVPRVGFLLVLAATMTMMMGRRGRRRGVGVGVGGGEDGAARAAATTSDDGVIAATRTRASREEDGRGGARDGRRHT